MTDHTAIAAARTAGQAAEAGARAQADRLAEAERDLRQLRRDIADLSARVAALQRSLESAGARAEELARERDELSARLTQARAALEAARRRTESRAREVATAEAELQDLRDQAEIEFEPGRRPPVDPALRAAIAAKAREVERLRALLRAAEGTAAAAEQDVGAVAAQVRAADTRLSEAQRLVATLRARRDEVQAALHAATARLPAAQTLPGQLRDQLAAAREDVAAAWQPWEALLRAAHAQVAAASTARDAAAVRLSQRESDATEASDALTAAQRSGDGTRIQLAQVRAESSRAAVVEARRELTEAAAALDRRRRDLVEGQSADDVVRLVAADVPLALLPVRLETRFEPRDDAGDLLVRVYPDAIHVRSHEPELTPDELTWGRHFLEQERAAADDAAGRQAAWAQLADRYGAPRAAWIARTAEQGDPPRRAAEWTRAPSAALLPDCWIAMGYRGGSRRFTAVGNPIPDDLAVGPDPRELAAPDPTVLLGSGAGWLVDFEEAVAVGMALRIPLTAEDTHGVDRLLVLGVSAGSDREASARRLAELLEAHRYSDGLALVRPGTPTNNAPSVASGWTGREDRHTTWQAERGNLPGGGGSDADLLAGALGLEAPPLSSAAQGEVEVSQVSRHMNSALWPLTWGYLLEHLVGGFGEGALAEVRGHVIDHVRAAGPLPALRVGRQPYGVLPVTSLEEWALLDPAGVDAQVPPMLRRLAPLWRAAAESVPHVTLDGDIDEVVLEALTMSPYSLAYASRGVALHPNPDADDTFARYQNALGAARALDLPMEPLLARAGYEAGVTELNGPAVMAHPSESEPLPAGGNYIAWLVDSGLDQIRSGRPPAGGNTLLFALLRHALLRQYASTAVRVLRARDLAEPGEGVEPGLGATGPSPWSRLSVPVDGVTGAATLGQHLDAVRSSGDLVSSPVGEQLRELVELQASLRHLAAVPTAALGRALAGALDVASHRLDAWVTAHADRRLQALRAETSLGVRLGGYGVLEDVRPAPVRRLGDRIAQLENDLAAARVRASQADAAAASLGPPLAAAQTRTLSAQRAVATLAGGLAAAERALERLQEDTRPHRPGVISDTDPDPRQDQLIRELQAEIDRLGATLVEAEARSAEVQAELAELAARAQRARAEAQAAAAEVTRLSALLVEAEAARQQAIELALNKGYVHAPSLGQAATAAVLRSGHLAHRRDQDSPLSVDLSSRRVRLALTLLEGIRAGQPLGALLGYRFERGLHEGHPGLELDRHIATLRMLAPFDATTQVQQDLGAALAHEAEITGRIGDFERDLNAAREADRLAKDRLRAEIATAQVELNEANTQARGVAARLRSEQAALEELLARVDEGGGSSHIPPWKLGDDDFPEGTSPQLMAAIEAKAELVAQLSASLDAANAVAARVGDRIRTLSAALVVPHPDISRLEQAIGDLQPELVAAREAVAALRARLDELGEADGRAAEVVRANNVVDGLALRQRWRTGSRDGRWDLTTIPFGDSALALPALGTPEQQAIDAELRAVDDAVDALADVLLAEGVHHLVQGNPLRAGATVDALSRGDAPPPEPEVVRTPRSGIGVEHRLLVLLGPDVADGGAGGGWPTDDHQVRAVVEPALEAWVSRLLGPAARVRVRSRYEWPQGEAAAEADLSVLRLSALDVVAMAVADTPTGGTELELRLTDHFSRHRPAGVPETASVTLVIERDPAWDPGDLGPVEFMEVARQVRDLVVRSRPADARDLALPGDGVDPGVDTADLSARALVAVTALDLARGALDAAVAAPSPDGLGTALRQAAMLGVPGATPDAAPGPGPDPVVTLVAQAGAVRQELQRRADAAAAADDDGGRIAAILGEDFTFLPRFSIANGTELSASLAASDELQGGDALGAVKWLQRAAHVREGAARLERALLYAEALGRPERLDLHVAQLPHRPDDRWAALPETPEHPIEGGRLSLVVQAAGTVPAPAATMAGLVVDEWSEVVPSATQETGLTFHFDQPNSRGPQAILLAVPPTEDHLWDLATLEAVVQETLDLARARLVDPEIMATGDPRAGRADAAALSGLGHYLPGIFLASAPADETVTTDLGLVAPEIEVG